MSGRSRTVTTTLDLALQASGLEQAKLADRPGLLSDNGSSYIAGDLTKWFADRTSATSMRANQMRLGFASFAYVLLCAFDPRIRAYSCSPAARPIDRWIPARHAGTG